jgi:hypothetical protein
VLPNEVVLLSMAYVPSLVDWSHKKPKDNTPHNTESLPKIRL